MAVRMPLKECSLGAWKWNCSSSSSRPPMVHLLLPLGKFT